MSKITFIINTETRFAHKFSESYFRKELSDYDLTFYYTEYEGHEGEFAKLAVENNSDIVAVVGGDGSIHYVVQELVFSNIKLALLPSSIGSSFANYYNCKKSNKHLLDTIKQGTTITSDLLRVNIDSSSKDIYSCCYVGLGYTAYLAKNLKQLDRSYYSRFWMKTFNLFNQYKKTSFNAEYNFFKGDLQVFEFVISNINQFGGKLTFFDSRSADDRVINLARLDKISWFRLFFYSINSLLGFPDFILDKVDYSKTEDITIRFDEPSLVQIDMESYTVKRRLDVQIIPDTLKVIVFND